MAQKTKNSKAKSLIVQCIDDNKIESLRGKKTEYTMWQTLKEKYEKRDYLINYT